MKASATFTAGMAAIAFAAGGARAQTASVDSNSAAPYGPPVADQHIWVHGMLDQFEARVQGSGSALRWDAEAWTGPDEWRVWLKSEGELTRDRVTDGQTEAYFSKPISTYWDVQVGGRYDLDSGPGRGWAAAGLEGLAPYFFHVAATAYASDQGRYAAKLKVSYDQLLTNRLILQPEGEINLYARDDPARRIGSGLSDLDAGLRLRYDITRKIAPYLGVAYEQKLGRTAELARAAGEGSADVRLALGVRAWF